MEQIKVYLLIPNPLGCSLEAPSTSMGSIGVAAAASMSEGLLLFLLNGITRISGPLFEWAKMEQRRSCNCGAFG